MQELEDLAPEAEKLGPLRCAGGREGTSMMRSMRPGAAS